MAPLCEKGTSRSEPPEVPAGGGDADEWRQDENSCPVGGGEDGDVFPARAKTQTWCGKHN